MRAFLELRPERALALMLLLAQAAASQSIVNGSMNGVADVTAFNGVTPPGWTGTVGGTDLWAATTSVASTAWLPSADGGTFVHGIGLQTGVEWIEQTVSGLTVGAVYFIGFEQSISDSVFLSRDLAGFWRVSFGPDTLDSAVMTVPSFGVPFPWQTQVLSFVASAPSQLLRFTAFNVTPLPPAKRADCALDGVTIWGGCSPAVAGTETVRLGSPPNPSVLIPSLTGPPVIAHVWDPYIDHGAFVPGAAVDVYLFSLFPENLPSGSVGTVLGSPPIHWELRTPGDTLHFTIPTACALVELRLVVQGASFDPVSPGWKLTNSLDISIGSL